VVLGRGSIMLVQADRLSSSSKAAYGNPAQASSDHLCRRPSGARASSPPPPRRLGEDRSTQADSYTHPSQRKRSMEELLASALQSGIKPNKPEKASGWLRPEMAMGSAAADVVWGHGPMAPSGERAARTPRQGWRPSSQELFVRITQGAAGSQPAGKERRLEEMTRGRHVHPHPQPRGLQPAGSLEWGTGSPRVDGAAQRAGAPRQRADAGKALAIDGRRTTDDHFSGSTMQMDSAHIEAEGAKVLAHPPRMQEDSFEGPSLLVASAPTDPKHGDAPRQRGRKRHTDVRRQPSGDGDAPVETDAGTTTTAMGCVDGTNFEGTSLLIASGAVERALAPHLRRVADAERGLGTATAQSLSDEATRTAGATSSSLAPRYVVEAHGRQVHHFGRREEEVHARRRSLDSKSMSALFGGTLLQAAARSRPAPEDVGMRTRMHRNTAARRMSHGGVNMAAAFAWPSKEVVAAPDPPESPRRRQSPRPSSPRGNGLRQRPELAASAASASNLKQSKSASLSTAAARRASFAGTNAALTLMGSQGDQGVSGLGAGALGPSAPATDPQPQQRRATVAGVAARRGSLVGSAAGVMLAEKGPEARTALARKKSVIAASPITGLPASVGGGDRPTSAPPARTTESRLSRCSERRFSDFHTSLLVLGSADPGLDDRIRDRLRREEEARCGPDLKKKAAEARAMAQEHRASASSAVHQGGGAGGKRAASSSDTTAHSQASVRTSSDSSRMSALLFNR
jgi:hypothetical protein